MTHRGGVSIWDWMLVATWIVVVGVGILAAIQPGSTRLSVGLALGAAGLVCVIAIYTANRLRGPFGDPEMPTDGPLWVVSVLIGVAVFVGFQMFFVASPSDGGPLSMIVGLVTYAGAFLWVNLLARALETATGRRRRASTDRP
jgi:hypothetical protein